MPNEVKYWYEGELCCKFYSWFLVDNILCTFISFYFLKTGNMCNPAFFGIRGMGQVGNRRKGKGKIEVR